MPEFQDMDFHSLIIDVGDVALLEQLVPSLFDASAGNLARHRPDHQQLVVELPFLAVVEGDGLVLGQLGDLVQKSLHEEPGQSLVVVDRVLRDHEDLLIDDVQDFFAEVGALVLTDDRAVLDLKEGIQKLLYALALLLHALLQHPPQILVPAQLPVERVHELVLQDVVDHRSITQDFRQLPQEVVIYFEAPAHELVHHPRVELGVEGADCRRIRGQGVAASQGVLHHADQDLIVVVVVAISLDGAGVEIQVSFHLLQHQPAKQLIVFVFEFLDAVQSLPLVGVPFSQQHHFAHDLHAFFFGLDPNQGGVLVLQALVYLFGDLGTPLDHAVDQGVLFQEVQVQLHSACLQYLIQ